MKKASLIFKAFIIIGLSLFTIETLRTQFEENSVEVVSEPDVKLKKLEKWLTKDVYNAIESADKFEWTDNDNTTLLLSEEDGEALKHALLNQSSYSFEFVKSAPLIVDGYIRFSNGDKQFQIDVSTYARKIVFPVIDKEAKSNGKPVIDYLSQSALDTLLDSLRNKTSKPKTEPS